MFMGEIEKHNVDPRCYSFSLKMRTEQLKKFLAGMGIGKRGVPSPCENKEKHCMQIPTRFSIFRMQWLRLQLLQTNAISIKFCGALLYICIYFFSQRLLIACAIRFISFHILPGANKNGIVLSHESLSEANRSRCQEERKNARGETLI